jgi:hypothetical protein
MFIFHFTVMVGFGDKDILECILLELLVLGRLFPNANCQNSPPNYCCTLEQGIHFGNVYFYGYCRFLYEESIKGMVDSDPALQLQIWLQNVL